MPPWVDSASVSAVDRGDDHNLALSGHERGVENMAKQPSKSAKTAPICSDPSKTERIQKKLAKLHATYRDLPGNKMIIAEPLIQNAAFMEVELGDLQKSIAEEGAIDDYQNGENQKGVKIGANLQAYNSLIKSYNMVSQRLEAMLPPDTGVKNKLARFTNARK